MILEDKNMRYVFDTNVDTGEISRKFNDYSVVVEENFLDELEELNDRSQLDADSFCEVFNRYVLTERGYPYFKPVDIEVQAEKLACRIIPTEYNPFRNEYIGGEAEEILTIYND